MIWVAIEDANTYDISDFERMAEKQVLCLMDDYRIDKHDAKRFKLHDMEDGHNVVYDGVTYKGGFGFNLWVASKYVEV